jgi:hypothetical protein
MMQYIKTDYPRAQGLCNRLFPIARAIVYQHLFGGRILHPSLAHFRSAPFRLGGIDYKKSFRKILLFDNFNLSDDKKYLSRTATFIIDHKSKANSIIADRCDTHIDADNCLIIFEGSHHEKHHFIDLYPYREIIKSELLSICKQKWQHLINNIQPYPIGLNIRLGNDFRSSSSKEDFKNVPFIKTPINWFIDTLLEIRKCAGYDVEAKIVTDGTARQLERILSLPNVTLLETPCAMTDLFALSKCQILLGSGDSSFCAWASFLAKIPTLTRVGRGLERFQLIADKTHWVEQYDPDYLEIEKINYIYSILKNSDL